ncbi:MAG: hypothetical protein A2Y77_04685 [Planctomycetes bacterium RBG_13_62_9]|nr:MAG: hypothetical protein A2Y77_04685 [Planctomycetes bacterium RBG_13_62_9]
MRDFSPNRYERAFESWLLDHHVRYVRSDEHRRLGPSYKGIKNFDFLLLPRPDRKVIVEVKGRTFAGTTLAGLTGLDCWVTLDDIESLQVWKQALGRDHEAVFVFAYHATQADVDFDGCDSAAFHLDRYVFFCIRLDDYVEHMKRRSPRWHTMTLPAESFRRCASSLSAFLAQAGTRS